MSSVLAEYLSSVNLHEFRKKDLQPSSLKSPVTNRNLQIEPLPMELLYVKGNGLDLNLNTKKDYGFRYEIRCFEIISASNADYDRSLILGPRLIDKILALGFSHYCRPDSIGFDIVENSEWKITDFFEFKSGKELNGVSRKLNGFSELLDILRTYPEFLPQLLKVSLPNIKKQLPDRLNVPPDRMTSITFVSPKVPTENILFRSSHIFHKVEHLKV